MAEQLTDSQFYMWRALFALVHADGVVTAEEIRFMAEILEDIPFNGEQRIILNQDITQAQDVTEMFASIADPEDQAAFFEFARELVWVDGDYGAEEQEIMLKLKEIHVQNTDINALVGKIDLELEGGDAKPRFTSLRKDAGAGAKADNLKSMLTAFKSRFRGGV